jgi:ribosomal protein S3
MKKSTEYCKRWQSKNKDYSNYLKDRSKARSFIRNKATNDDIKELEILMINRKEELKKDSQ